MLRFVRSRVWQNSQSVPRLFRLLRGRASPRRARLLAAAVGRELWWHLPLWLPGTEHESHVQRAIEMAEQVADGSPRAEWDEVVDAAEQVLGQLSSWSREACLLRPIARTGWQLLRVLTSGDLGDSTFPDAKPGLVVPLIRDVFGNPFRPVTFDPAWQSDTAVSLARQMYDSRDFSALPILADALQDAGCDNDEILSHCREPGPHVRGCWVVDLVLGKS